MTTATGLPTTETTLYMKRTFRTSREQVFNAWTQPEKLKEWFAASNDFVGSTAEIDLRVGGTFRMSMQHVPTGKHHVATGVYKEIRFPERLVFTWFWEQSPEKGENRITIDLRDIDGETEMRFTQEFLPSKDVRDDHERGWNGCFQRMEELWQS